MGPFSAHMGSCSAHMGSFSPHKTVVCPGCNVLSCFVLRVAQAQCTDIWLVQHVHIARTVCRACASRSCPVLRVCAQCTCWCNEARIMVTGSGSIQNCLLLPQMTVLSPHCMYNIALGHASWCHLPCVYLIQVSACFFKQCC